MYSSVSQGVLTEEQSLQLYNYFEANKYPSADEIQGYAVEFGVDVADMEVLFQFGQKFHFGVRRQKRAEKKAKLGSDNRFRRQEYVRRRREADFKSSYFGRLVCENSEKAKARRIKLQPIIEQKDKLIEELRMTGNNWREEAETKEKKLAIDMKRTDEVEMEVDCLSQLLENGNVEIGKKQKAIQELQNFKEKKYSEQDVMDALKHNQELRAEMEKAKKEVAELKISEEWIAQLENAFKVEHNRLRQLVREREQERDQLKTMVAMTMQASHCKAYQAENGRLKKDVEEQKSLNRLLAKRMTGQD